MSQKNRRINFDLMGRVHNWDRAILISKSYRPLPGRNNIVKVNPVKNYGVYGDFDIHILFPILLVLFS